MAKVEITAAPATALALEHGLRKRCDSHLTDALFNLWHAKPFGTCLKLFLVALAAEEEWPGNHRLDADFVDRAAFVAAFRRAAIHATAPNGPYVASLKHPDFRLMGVFHAILRALPDYDWKCWTWDLWPEYEDGPFPD